MMPLEVSQKLIYKALKALIFPIFYAIFDDGLFSKEPLQMSAREWNLFKIRNPGIDGINYNKVALSMAKRDSIICKIFS